MPGALTQIDGLLRRACVDVTPGCVALVWRAGSLRYHAAHGSTASHPAVPAEPVSLDTQFDLASLTKVLATTTLTALAVQSGRVDLDAAVPEPWATACPSATLADVLEHAAGFAAHREFFAAPWSARDAATLLRQIADVPAAYERRTQAVYSDLGFMVLGAWLERVWGVPLDRIFVDAIGEPLGISGAIGFRRLATVGTSERANASPWTQVAATEVYDAALHDEPPTWFGVRAGDSTLRWAQGQVHDDNAYVMGGVAGHAGLFGTAHAVLEIALAWIDESRLGLRPSTLATMLVASTVPGSTRRRGWDAPSPDGGGSTADAVSPAAFGHLGFTGTSLWIDPRPGDPRVYVLLTNRVHPTRGRAGIAELRRAFHRLAAQI